MVRRATCSEDAAVGFKTLKKWALRSHVNRLPGRDESSLLRDAFEGNDVRRRTGKLLQKVPRGAHEHELDRLRRVLSRLEDSEAEQDIAESIRVILLFEECFRLSLLVFQRLLWFCQQVPPFALPLADAAEDSVLSRVKTQIARCGPKLDAAIAGSQTPRFRQELERLADTNSFVQALATAGSTTQMIERVLARHRDVQRAKSDGGRPKMPWLEIRNGRVVPTLSAAQRIPRGPESLSQVLAHPYRTVAADRFHRNGIA